MYKFNHVTPAMIRRKEGWLRARGFDGLMGEDECGCLIGDLAPCGERENFDACTPGRLTQCRCEGNRDGCITEDGKPWCGREDEEADNG